MAKSRKNTSPGDKKRIAVNPLRIYSSADAEVFHFKGKAGELKNIGLKKTHSTRLFYIVRGKDILLRSGKKITPVEFAVNTQFIVHLQEGGSALLEMEKPNEVTELFIISLTDDFALNILPEGPALFAAFRQQITNCQQASLTGYPNILTSGMKTVLYELLTIAKGNALIRQLLTRAKIMELMALQLEQAELSSSGHPVASAKEITIAHAAASFLEGCDGVHDFSLISLADNIGTNETSLKYAFKKVYGTTVFKYFQDLRMEKAKGLLETGKKIGEVSALVGYSAMAHFSKAYKQHYNINPSRIYK